MHGPSILCVCVHIVIIVATINCFLICSYNSSLTGCSRVKNQSGACMIVQSTVNTCMQCVYSMHLCMSTYYYAACNVSFPCPTMRSVVNHAVAFLCNIPKLIIAKPIYMRQVIKSTMNISIYSSNNNYNMHTHT